MENISGNIFDIQHFCTHDGPGIRTTVFLKGCPLRCMWCHNPESRKSDMELFYHHQKCVGCRNCEENCPHNSALEILKDSRLRIQKCFDCKICADNCVYGAIEKIGRKMTVDEVIEEVVKDLSYYSHSGGGMTLSGGEAMAQPLFSKKLLESAKSKDIHTAIETSGHGSRENILSLIKYTDLFLWDIKATNEEQHLKLTGVSLAPILENLKAVSSTEAQIVLRLLFIPEIHDNDEYIRGLVEIINSLAYVPEFEFVPYHGMGLSKFEKLGIKQAPSFREPSPEEINFIKERLLSKL